MSTIVRIGRHAATDSHIAALRAAFGSNVEITQPQDVPYGNDPVAAVKAALDGWHNVAAVEAAGPEPVLIALVQGLGVPVIRPVFRRNGDRVAVVGQDANGRDIFEVERYDALAIENRPTIVGRPVA